MGLFSGGNSTVSPQTTTNITETTREVNQQLQDSLGISAEGRSTVNITDAGAIQQNANIARAALEGGERIVTSSNRLLDSVVNTVAGTRSSVTDALRQSLDFARGFASDANALVKQSTSGALASVERATQTAIGAVQPSVDVKQFGIVAVIVLGAVIFFVSRK